MGVNEIFWMVDHNNPIWKMDLEQFGRWTPQVQTQTQVHTDRQHIIQIHSNQLCFMVRCMHSEYSYVPYIHKSYVHARCWLPLVLKPQVINLHQETDSILNSMLQWKWIPDMFTHQACRGCWCVAKLDASKQLPVESELSVSRLALCRLLTCRVAVPVAHW